MPVATVAAVAILADVADVADVATVAAVSDLAAVADVAASRLQLQHLQPPGQPPDWMADVKPAQQYLDLLGVSLV